MGTTLLEDVAAAAPDPAQHMFQLYVIKDRDFTRQLVQVCAQGGLIVQHGRSVAVVDGTQMRSVQHLARNL